MLWDINKEKLDECAVWLKEQVKGVAVDVMVVNLANKEQTMTRARECLSSFGSPHVIVNNAGVISGNSSFLQSDDVRNVRSMEVNCFAHMWMTKAFLPSMIERKEGHFINVASAAAFIPAPGMVDYATSKAAAVGFAEGLSLELQYQGYHNIHVSALCPAHIATDLFKGFGFGTAADSTLTVEEVANAAVAIAEGAESTCVILPKFLRLVVGLKGWTTGVGRSLGLGVAPMSPMKQWDSTAANERWKHMEHVDSRPASKL